MTTASTQLGSADKATTLAVDAFLRRGPRSGIQANASKVGNAEGATKASAKQDETLREVVGEFVGNVFYGTLLRQMEQSSIKGEYMHGGRGEEVFQTQLHMEYAKRLGRAPGDPIADRIYDALTRGKREAEQRAARAADNATGSEAPKNDGTSTADRRDTTR